MLEELHVHDLALIEDAVIEFSSGLTALTGETGAGKTAMLSALGLVRGDRADSASVREGCDEACVEARVAKHAQEHVIRRRVSAKGRSKCYVDGAMATVAELAQLASNIRIHGQNESSRLVDPGVQASYLDTWITADCSHTEPYRKARLDYLSAARRLREFEKAKSAAARELEFMRFQFEQIEKAKPRAGEYEELSEEMPRLMHAEQLAAAVDGVQQALNADGAVLDMLAQASRALERETGIDAQLDEIASRIEEAQLQLSDTARDLSSYAAGLTFDPYRLERAMERMDVLQGLMQRFGPTMDDVFKAYDDAQAVIEAAGSSPAVENQLRKEADEAERDLRAEAQKLSELRHERALEFCAQLVDAVEPLAMKGVGFSFSFEPLDFAAWTDEGSEHIELMYSPSPASTPRPLARIASGGELSRISLALECLHFASADSNSDVTFVFDEIDQGVGGATGKAVAERLAQLAQVAQVIVVTHLPQVAARADAHYVIEKDNVPEGLPSTRVELVEADRRTSEIARMLAGTVDETSLEHARSLLEG